MYGAPQRSAAASPRPWLRVSRLIIALRSTLGTGHVAAAKTLLLDAINERAEWHCPGGSTDRGDGNSCSPRNADTPTLTALLPLRQYDSAI